MFVRACFLLLLFCISADAHTREQVLHQETLRFTSSLSDASEVFADSKALLDKLCQKNGLICKLTAYPPGRALRMLQENESVGEMPRFEEFQQMAPTAIRVPTSLGQLSFSVLTHDKNLTVKSMSELRKHKVFYVRGNAVIAAHKEMEHLIPVASEADCAFMVLRKHGDACIMTKSLALKIMENSKLAPDSYLLQDLFFKPVYLYLSPRYKFLLEQFDQSIRQLRAEEKIAQ